MTHELTTLGITGVILVFSWFFTIILVAYSDNKFCTLIKECVYWVRYHFFLSNSVSWGISFLLGDVLNLEVNDSTKTPKRCKVKKKNPTSKRWVIAWQDAQGLRHSSFCSSLDETYRFVHNLRTHYNGNLYTDIVVCGPGGSLISQQDNEGIVHWVDGHYSSNPLIIENSAYIVGANATEADVMGLGWRLNNSNVQSEQVLNHTYSVMDRMATISSSVAEEWRQQRHTFGHLINEDITSQQANIVEPQVNWLVKWTSPLLNGTRSFSTLEDAINFGSACLEVEARNIKIYAPTGETVAVQEGNRILIQEAGRDLSLNGGAMPGDPLGEQVWRTGEDEPLEEPVVTVPASPGWNVSWGISSGGILRRYKTFPSREEAVRFGDIQALVFTDVRLHSHNGSVIGLFGTDESARDLVSPSVPPANPDVAVDVVTGTTSPVNPVQALTECDSVIVHQILREIEKEVQDQDMPETDNFGLFTE
jgi:hypothetical protein